MDNYQSISVEEFQSNPFISFIGSKIFGIWVRLGKEIKIGIVYHGRKGEETITFEDKSKYLIHLYISTFLLSCLRIVLHGLRHFFQFAGNMNS